MSLATRCPACNTLFKVSSGQLQLHEGKVRCGQCQTVFSGIDHLTAPDTEAWQKLDLSPKPAAATSLQADTSDAHPEFMQSRGSHFGWRLHFPPTSLAMKLGCAVLLLMLLLQWAWWQRLNLVSAIPALADQLGSSNPAVQKKFSSPATQALEVEGSGLQALDENTVRMDVTLHNSHQLPTSWPYLKVDLLDSQGLILASKSLAPTDYQVREGSAINQAGPIPGGETVEVLAFMNLSKLNKQLPESAATGFQLELFDVNHSKQQ